MVNGTFTSKKQIPKGSMAIVLNLWNNVGHDRWSILIKNAPSMGMGYTDLEAERIYFMFIASMYGNIE